MLFTPVRILPCRRGLRLLRGGRSETAQDEAGDHPLCHDAIAVPQDGPSTAAICVSKSAQVRVTARRMKKNWRGPRRAIRRRSLQDSMKADFSAAFSLRFRLRAVCSSGTPRGVSVSKTLEACGRFSECAILAAIIGGKRFPGKVFRTDRRHVVDPESEDVFENIMVELTFCTKIVMDVLLENGMDLGHAAYRRLLKAMIGENTLDTGDDAGAAAFTDPSDLASRDRTCLFIVQSAHISFTKKISLYIMKELDQAVNFHILNVHKESGAPCFMTGRIDPSSIPDVRPHRRDATAIEADFADAHPPLSADAAVIEANRCYFCFDAPCTAACPTGIDVPGFIRGIASGNLRGSALLILEENIFGGSCARVCPTEILCELACVRLAEEGRPVAIGALQRYATDWMMARPGHPFAAAPANGRRIAVVGAGPAGLSCAHRLARAGYRVDVFESRDKPGGLNEYGVAAYKLPGRFAQEEVDFLLGIGGITLITGRTLGVDFTLARLRRDYDAVFLGIGLGGVKSLGIGEAPLFGVEDAVSFIARLRQARNKAEIPVGRRVVVIGGGNTAIDVATQARLLGAEEVVIVYRRGPGQMPATAKERAWAQTHGVTIKYYATPVRLVGEEGAVRGVVFARTRSDSGGRLLVTDEEFMLPADQVFKAVGQSLVLPGGEDLPVVEGGRIVVDAARRTTLPRVYAGGDCTAGLDLTVRAVQDGKIAAMAIDALLQAGEEVHG